VNKTNLSGVIAGSIVIVSAILSYIIANVGANYDTLEFSALFPFYVLPVVNLIIIIFFNAFWNSKQNKFSFLIWNVSILLVLGLIFRLATII
jgi:hypothetical protein